MEAGGGGGAEMVCTLMCAGGNGQAGGRTVVVLDEVLVKSRVRRERGTNRQPLVTNSNTTGMPEMIYWSRS